VELKEYLQQANELSFVDLDEQIDHKMLRTLDDMVEGQYRTLVSTKLEAMRGIDYRAPTKGITLLICQQFNNKREANQAGYRVGR
jgi:hypothetical protein